MDSDYTGGSSASYTGGSDTTGSTDDSGFGGDIYMNVREAADEYMNTQRSTWTLVLGSIAIVIVMFGLGLGSSNYVMSLI